MIEATAATTNERMIEGPDMFLRTEPARTLGGKREKEGLASDASV